MLTGTFETFSNFRNSWYPRDGIHSPKIDSPALNGIFIKKNLMIKNTGSGAEQDVQIYHFYTFYTDFWDLSTQYLIFFNPYTVQWLKLTLSPSLSRITEKNNL